MKLDGLARRATSAIPVTFVALVLFASTLSGCSDTERTGEAVPSRAAAASPSARVGDPYVGLARDLARRGVQIWFEVDLVRAWLDSPTAFDRVLRRTADLARGFRPVGFKVADELGYEDGITSAASARRFLRAVNSGLHAHVPGTLVAVDMIVPELGCLVDSELPGPVTCRQRARHRYPAASVAAVRRYLEAGLIDVLDLSTGLLSPRTYGHWGVSRVRAQEAAWTSVEGWPGGVRLRSRKALAQRGGYRGTTAQTRRALHLYVDIPARHGAEAADLWTWRQPYAGQVVSLFPDDLHPTALQRALIIAHSRGQDLLTHITPSRLPGGVKRARELDLYARCFTSALVAGGAG